MKLMAVRTSWLLGYSLPFLCFTGQVTADSNLRGRLQQPALIQALEVEVQTNITTAALALEQRLQSELETQLQGELANFRRAESQLRTHLLGSAQAQFQDQQIRRNRILDSSFSVAKRDFEKASLEAVESNITDMTADTKLRASASDLLEVVKEAGGQWQLTSNQSYVAARKSVNAWWSVAAPLNVTYEEIVKGLSRLNDASQAVTRASRSVRWDEQSSRLAADYAESTELEHQKASLEVQKALELSKQANTLVNSNRETIEAIGGFVNHAEDESSAAHALSVS
jgi:hypothetical protein